MKSDLKAKLLQHFSKKKTNGGFTLIELLVVIIIIGILSAIALPSFLNQANKARQSEAKTYTGSMNRAQQAYYLENNEFSNAIPLLGLGIASVTDNYSYTITMAGGAAAGEGATANARPQPEDSASVKAYIGGVKIGSVEGTNEATTLAVLCEAVAAPINEGADGSQEAASLDSSVAGAPTCPTVAGEAYKTIK